MFYKFHLAFSYFAQQDFFNPAEQNKRLWIFNPQKLLLEKREGVLAVIEITGLVLFYLRK